MAEGRPLPSLAGAAELSAHGARQSGRPAAARRAGRGAGDRAASATRRWPRSPPCASAARRIGCVAVQTRAELLGALRLARDAGCPWFVLGNGSDLVVADAGIRGLVIRNRARAVTVDGLRLEADAGRADGPAGPHLHRRWPGRPRVRDEHPRHARRGGLGQRRGARQRDARRRRHGRGVGSARRLGLHAWHAGVRLCLPRVALQAQSGGDPLGGAHACAPTSRPRSPPAWRPTRRSGSRPSRSPTRTRAASSATRPATTPAG